MLIAQVGGVELPVVSGAAARYVAMRTAWTAGQARLVSVVVRPEAQR